MSLADYLAKNYLTADPPAEKKSKKRKRKGAKSETSGLIIADDDISGWNAIKAEDEDDDAPMIFGTITSSKPKSKNKSSSSTSTWKTIGVPAPSTSSQLAADNAAVADAIIAQTAADRTTAAADEDEAPEMVDTDNILKMESGAHAGLQTAAQVAAALKKRQEEDRKQAAAVAREMGAVGNGETIYRDASGRIINVAMKRAEARKAAEAAERAKLEKEKAARGDVQRAEAEKRKEALKDAKYMPVARGIDDAELNEDLKEQDRWNDPAAGFLVKKKAGKSITGRPLYKGAAPPNRYKIRPGHRWDGVDRGNGFEGEWFRARNKKGNLEKLEYAWQMDE
ncbi:hypothetical protein K432DRAFT_412732 [Lepidopterella palustris CBS 459.81]|uniref:Pre-mRNA-splicing factor CWC26 n=1 Tax=Lepidopterella palustris CBS 459.81 TaxID=1314670 RepID=A0A8E2ELX3_9PEZI|nr:hypothetical protein K432DRAFT_412732 [Lepidopterella palustris CBS 459.81]